MFKFSSIDRMVLFVSFMYSRNVLVLSPVVLQMKHILFDRAWLTKTLCFRCEQSDFTQFMIFPVLP